MTNTVVETGETVANAADSGQASQEQPPAEQQQEMVPLAALQAERRDRQQAQEQAKMLQDHVALIQANHQQEAPKQETLADDDVVTYGEIKKMYGQIENQYKMSVEELRIQQKHPDYNETVTKYLPDVIKENPALKTTLENDSNRYELAYFLSKNSDAYRGDNKKAKKSADAQRIVDNGNRAGSLSAVGSTAPSSQVNDFKSMSDDDFMKRANRNLGRF